jgi:uncharacterized membrane protein YdbT with pleckstrin-like domain
MRGLCCTPARVASTLMSIPAEPAESLIWRGSPSQWTNFGTYLFCLLLTAAIIAGAWYAPAEDRRWVLLALIVPVLWAVARWVRTRRYVYEVTTERVKITTGVLSRRTSELELYRVRDYSVVEPFLLRLLGAGHVVLVTADRTTPELELRAVPDAARLKDQIRTHTERMRQRRGVRDLELDPAQPPPAPPAA